MTMVLLAQRCTQLQPSLPEAPTARQKMQHVAVQLQVQRCGSTSCTAAVAAAPAAYHSVHTQAAGTNHFRPSAAAGAAQLLHHK
jgi:hypothetical protein